MEVVLTLVSSSVYIWWESTLYFVGVELVFHYLSHDISHFSHLNLPFLLPFSHSLLVFDDLHSFGSAELMMTVPLEDFVKWEETGFEPEKEFLEKLNSIEGVSQVETQTITNYVLDLTNV